MKKILEVSELSKSILKAKALTDINFHIFEGETVGLVGESGCGKSLIAKTLLRIESKDTGRILYRGNNIDLLPPHERSLLCSKIQIIFQDPNSSLNPKMRIKDIIAEPLDIHYKLLYQEREYRIDELLRSVGLDIDYKKRFPHELSGGQKQRVSIARAISLNPELLICDEPISALDVSNQTVILNLLKKLQKEKNLALLFISHDLSAVKQISNRIIVMYLGHIIEIGDSETLYQSPKHPYTQALLSSIPLANPILEKQRTKIVLKGEIPSIFHLPTGCPFQTRCPKVMNICYLKSPKWTTLSSKQSVYCHLFDAV